MSSVNSIEDAQAQNHNINKELNPETNDWLGKRVCALDKVTWLLGALLIITGIVLLVLNGLHTANLFLPGVAAISVGPVILALGVFFNCCSIGGCLSVPRDDFKKNLTTSAIGDNKNEAVEPLDAEKSTKAFFEERGIFGVPQALIDEIDIWRKYRTSENFGITLDAGFILEGPPGTGKTTIAQAIADILGGEYLEKKCGELNEPLHGNTEKNIINLFTVPENQFRVVVIDEISGLLPIRRGLYWTDHITEHFLGVVSGTAQKKPPYILIGTTNNFQELDPALVRRGRLGKTFTITNPDRDARLKIYHHHLSKIKHSEDEDWNSFIESIADSSDGCSCADITGMIGDAQRKALLANRDLRTADFN